MLRALALILSPAHPLPAVLSDERLRQRETAAKLLATFDVPVSEPLPDSLFTETTSDTTYDSR